MIKPDQIELLNDLSQSEYNGRYYDLHNDFNCQSIEFTPLNTFVLKFCHNSLKNKLSLTFHDVQVESFKFFNSNDVDGLTIDTLYRGRAEHNGRLLEFLHSNLGYFYLEFYEGQKVEFWSSGISIGT